MILLTLYIFCFVLIGIVGVMAARSDYNGLKIPNWHSAAVVVAFALCYGGMWLGGLADDVFGALVPHLLAALIVFLVTLAMFAARMLGAADSKLGTAYALWTGLGGMMPFLFYMALAGGVLALVALGLRRWKPVKAAREGSWVARVQAGESKVPYGIAIVFGALVSFIEIGYFSAETLAVFLAP